MRSGRLSSVLRAIPVATVIILLPVGSAWAADPASSDQASRDKLMGKWVESGTSPEPETSWTFTDKGTALEVTSTDSKNTTEFDCNVVGKECSTKHAKVSLWFNGPKLVEMETMGSHVIKRRFSVASDGTLDVETIPMVPSGATETAHFKRAPTQTAKQ